MKRFHFGMLASAATLLASAGTAMAQCPAGEIADCNGNCCPETWVGDGYCDDGTFTYNGIAIFLNCEQFGNDGGDCGTTDCQIPAGTSTEAELCGEDLNGGCNGGAYDPAAIGAEIGGTFWATVDTRDTDWYELTVTEATEISLEIYSNIPCFAAVVDAACGGIVGSATTGACPGTTSVCVAPGTYYVVALPSVFESFPCGGTIPNDYTLKIGGVACDATPPANDTCANASVAVEGSNPFDNTFANTDWGVPSCGFNGVPFTKDVFFTFTPATTGFWSLETCSGSAPFDTGIEVFDGCPDAGGTQIACNDDGAGCAALASSLVFEGTAGVTYTILVGGYNGAAGATELVIAAGACPAGQIEDCNGNCAPENWIADGYCDDGTYIFGGVAICLNCEQFGFDGGDCTVQGDCNGGGGGGGGGGCGTGGDCCVAGTAGGCIDVECCTLICAGDAFCCDTQWDQLCADDAVAACAICGGGGGTPGLTCVDAIAIQTGNTAFNRTGATEDLDYAGVCDMGQFGSDTNFNVVWHKFAPTQSGTYTVSTCSQANHDTRLSVQTGCAASTVVACNDDGTGCTGFTSLLTFDAVCGQEYYILVGGYSATTTLGTGTLSVTTANGTDCSSPCAGDFNGDGNRDGADLGVLLAGWGTPAGDMNGDGNTDGADLGAFLAVFNLVCP
jgi:hypothetical protein